MTASKDSDARHPLLALPDEDLEFVLRFVLASGSLKELAQVYGVSYPTIRGKLDRLIARLEQLRQGRPSNPVADYLANLIERGEIAPGAARAILDLHRQAVQQEKEK